MREHKRGPGAVLLRCWDTVALAGYVVTAVLASSSRLVRGVLDPRHEFTSSILELGLRCRTGTEIGLFSLLVALSPSEVVVAVGTRPRRAFVYGLDAPDPAALTERMRDLETRVLRATRGRAAVEEGS